MNTKLALIVTAAGILATSTVTAATSGADLYNCGEISVDAFGFHGSRDKDGHGSGAWGPGAGVNYFFTQYIGVGADTYADAFEVPYLLNASAIVRYPILQTGVAPYIFGGGGREWTHTAQWLGHIGCGVEYRFRPEFGVFVDIRDVFPSSTKDYAVLRFGFRIPLRLGK